MKTPMVSLRGPPTFDSPRVAKTLVPPPDFLAINSSYVKVGLAGSLGVRSSSAVSFASSLSASAAPWAASSTAPFFSASRASFPLLPQPATPSFWSSLPLPVPERRSNCRWRGSPLLGLTTRPAVRSLFFALPPAAPRERGFTFPASFASAPPVALGAVLAFAAVAVASFFTCAFTTGDSSSESANAANVFICT